jgi:hypothetical protein
MNKVNTCLGSTIAKWILSRSLWIVLFSQSALFAQFKVAGLVSISVGVKAGVPLTDSFVSVTEPLPELGITEREFSRAKHYLVGPAVEVYLPLHLSIEADGLYRREDITRQFSGILQGGSREFGVWEVPILARYRLSSSLVAPFLELGPSFRVVQGGAPEFRRPDTPTGLSNAGVTAGGGLSVRLRHLDFGPEFRYTHWGSDDKTNSAIPSRRNQVEFLVGVSF